MCDKINMVKDMREYEFNGIKYVIEKDENKIFNYEELKEMITDYFNVYDYIFGDIAYGKLRLKGFCNKENKNFKKINDIATLDNYIKDYCAVGCKWFLIKKCN